MERVMGIEPTSSAWKAEVLPLNYTRFAKTDRSASSDTSKTLKNMRANRSVQQKANRNSAKTDKAFTNTQGQGSPAQT
jgi:hypothetical protein